MIHWGMQATALGRATGLALEVRDISVDTSSSMADQSMDVGIGDAEVVTAKIETGVAIRINPLLTTARALDL